MITPVCLFVGLFVYVLAISVKSSENGVALSSGYPCVFVSFYQIVVLIVFQI